MMKPVIAAAAAALISALSPAIASDGGALNALLTSGDWLNGKLTQNDLRGKVVLVDFYTFDCINCKHVEPNLRRLYAGTPREDLVIVGVHSPETPYERNRDHLKTSLAEQGVRWPVVVDNDFRVWNAYGVTAWPTQLIFDRHGVLQQTIVGEGQDDAVDQTIRDLVARR